MRKEEFSTLPKLVQQYLVYIEAIKGHSEKSVLEYASDLRTFFRYIVKLKGLYSFDTEDEKIDLSPIDFNFIQSVNLEDAYQFMMPFSEIVPRKMAPERAATVSFTLSPTCR